MANAIYIDEQLLREAEQILEARKRTRKIPLYDLKED